MVKEFIQQIGLDTTFFAVTAVFVIRGAETGSGYGVGEVVKRPDVPAEKNIFSGAVLTDERNISGVSAITECNRKTPFSRRLAAR